MNLLLLPVFACASLGFAQVFGPTSEQPVALGQAGPRPLAGSLVKVDSQKLAAALREAPSQQLGRTMREYAALIQLPFPDGGLRECFIVESSIMEPQLQEKFPMLRSYVVAVVDGSANGRIEIAPRGLTGMLRLTDGGPSKRAWIIDPWQSGDPTHLISYWLDDLPGGGWVCDTVPGIHGQGMQIEEGEFHDREFQALRRYRIAVACTGDYGLYQCTRQGNPPNVVDPLAAIATAVGRVNVVYEQDLAVHFDLVANNDRVVFVDPATDPYPTTCDGLGGADCSGPVLSINTGVLNQTLGAANYDVGQALTRIVGGVAFLSSVCTSNKGGGVSGISRGGDVEIFSANIFIHELGHMFGANHTFSGTRGRCGNNANLSTAWEAGSGSSPMAYAGACPVGGTPPSDNIVEFADPFFHNGSVREMTTFLNSTTNSCRQLSVATNSIPVLTSTTPAMTIPRSTPFTLTALATDFDSEDVLTYSWEQVDSGVRRPLSGEGSGDNGAGALFRVFPPTADGSRTFPQWSDILTGVTTLGEQLPTVGDVTRNFRVIVRDNHPGAGATVVSGNVNLSIAANAGPFQVTSPRRGETIAAGPVTVNWDVSGTDLPPVECTSVWVDLSVDGGQTFEPLATDANDGSATIQLPAVNAPECYVMVRAEGSIFFAVSGAFEIFIPCQADITRDGGVDGDDVIAFFALWDQSDASADADEDGDVDGDDVVVFFGLWDVGC